MTRDEKLDHIISEVTDLKRQLSLHRKKILTVKDVALLLNRSEVWVYKLVGRQEMPFYRSFGRLHFKYDEIVKWWDENRYRPIS